MATKIQLRRGTATQWTTADPVLAAGEIGLETDTDKHKVGDGSTAWVSLGYATTPAAAHGLGGSEHTADTLANLNAKISDATLIDTGDARLSDARTPTSHAFAGAEHSASTLANVNTKISDATLIDTGDARLSDKRVASALGTSGADVNVDSAAPPTTGQVLKATSATTATWQAESGGGVTITQATATVNTTTTSTSYVLVDSMTLTPGAGDYLVLFSSSWKNIGAYDIWAAVFVNGVKVDHTERMMHMESSITDTEMAVTTHAYITGVGAGQDIEIRWKVEGSTGEMLQRTLAAQKV